MSTFTNYKPNYAIHPGEIIADYVDYNGWTQTELAERTGLSINTINRIIQAKPREDNKDRITSEVADRFAKVFGMKKSFFINLQTLYDESLPRQIESEEKEILKKLPYTEMVKFGWVPKTLKVSEKLKNLYAFFGIASLSNLLKVGAGAIVFRKKETEGFSPETLAIWLRKGELDCLSLEIPDFDKKKLKTSLEKIRSLTLKPFLEIKEELKEILLDCGVVLSYTPKLKNSCVNGASRWYKNSILIQISDSGKKEDIFWFTLFHELGHVLKHLKNKKDSFIDLENVEKNEYEIEADEFSRNALIPQDKYQKFIQKSFTKSDIESFTKECGVDRGILAGRLCFDGEMNYQSANSLRRRLEF